VVAGGVGVKTTENKMHWPRWLTWSMGDELWCMVAGMPTQYYLLWGGFVILIDCKGAEKRGQIFAKNFS
jgi:hypothetical protein